MIPIDHMTRSELEDEVVRLRKLNDQLNDNLTTVQRRCTELKELSRDASIIDEQVREFHDLMGIENRDRCGLPTADIAKLRVRLVLEEAFEFAIASLDSTTRHRFVSLLKTSLATLEVSFFAPDLPEVADALADIDYVVAGTRLAYGIPRKPVADEVHRANMAKAPHGVVLRDEFNKVRKPPGWTPPDIKKVLDLK